MTGLRICGRAISPSCVEGDCGECVSWRSEDNCSHECLYQARYGGPEDVDFITPDDW